MAEIEFFMNEDDSHEFIEFLIYSFSAEFIPEKSDSPPPFPRYLQQEEVHQRIKTDEHYSRFFVLSQRWEKHPLCFSEVNAKDGRHFYAVSERYGGPAFDFILSRTRSEGNLKWIISGSFADYPYYIRDKSFISDHSLYETFDRPAEMKTAYQEVQKFIRRNGVRSMCKEDSRAGAWILSGALADFENGTWLRVGDWHFEPKTRKAKPTRA